jgi:hypothetical protein
VLWIEQPSLVHDIKGASDLAIHLAVDLAPVRHPSQPPPRGSVHKPGVIGIVNPSLVDDAEMAFGIWPQLVTPVNPSLVCSGLRDCL